MASSGVRCTETENDTPQGYVARDQTAPGVLSHRPGVRGHSCRPRILERMTRSDDGRPAPPRLPPDLSSELDLRLTAGCEIDHKSIQGDFSDSDLEGLQVEDSRIVGSSFTAARSQPTPPR